VQCSKVFNAGLERSFLYSINSHLNYNIRDGAKLLPTGQAVADLIALTEDRGPAFKTGQLDYSLSIDSGMSTRDDRDLRNDEIHHTLLQKRDGRFLLILWADKDSHNGDTKSEAATLTLPMGAAKVRLFKPVSNGTKAVSTLGAVAAGGKVRLTGAVAIPDHPLIIELTPRPRRARQKPPANNTKMDTQTTTHQTTTNHTTARVRWGIIGAGHIAREFADGVLESATGTLVAIGSRTQESADKFASEYSKKNLNLRAHGSYQALLDDAEIDAVYIATPHPMHAEWAIKAAEAGKHLLVENPSA
jgi:hypothetical protein